MFCIIITEIWWDISNFCMAWGWSAFLRIFQKNCIINISSKIGDHWRKRGSLLYFHSNTNLVLAYILIHSVNKTNVLVATVELIWLLFLNLRSFSFFPTSNKSIRFRRFRRSYVNSHVVVPTNHCQVCVVLPFLLDAHCSK